MQYGRHALFHFQVTKYGMAMLRSENSLNEDLIDIMMEDERAETQPVARIATPPRPSKIVVHNLSRSPSPSPFGNSPAEKESPVIFTGHPNGISKHLLSPIPIAKQPYVSPVKDRHQNALSLKFVVDHDAKSNGLDNADGQNSKPEDSDKPVSHASSPNVNKMREFRNRLFPTYKNAPSLSSPHADTGTTPVTNTTSMQEDCQSLCDQPPPEPIELRIYQVGICLVA